MNEFDRALSRFTARWRLGLLLAAALRALALALLALTALGLLDYAAPFADSTRPVVFSGWLSVLALLALAALAPALRTGKKEAAACADATLPARRPVTTALEVAAQAGEMTPLRAFLTEKILWDGVRAIAELPKSATLPRRRILRALWSAAAVLALLGGLSIANFSAVKTIAARLLRPYHDIPPHSPLKFEITPALPKVVYGSDIELETLITGGPLPDGVRLLAREDTAAPVTTSGAFAIGGGRFGQRLQRVTHPVQVAFAAGAARSPWITVEVMRQPRLETVMLKVIPPAYSKLPMREFPLGSADLVALPGSEIEARISSNRPLSGGEALLSPPRSLVREPPETVIARADGGREVTLRWKVKWPCVVRLDLKDITGAGSAAPVELEQRLLPDQPPVVSLASPAGLTLATPESEVPLQIEVEDDLGLARIDLVRKLAGFRDRGLRLTEDAGDKVFSVDRRLSMKTLGVEPGHLLELYAEAHDHNPSLMGIASSPVGRVQIISTEDYTELMRARTSLEEFRARFSILKEAVDSVREALESGDKDAAKAAMEQARQTSADLAADFQAFDAEKKVAAEAEKIAAMMSEMRDQLDTASEADIEAMRGRLGAAAARAGKLQEEGRHLAEIGRVLEMAAEFKAMHAAQKRLTGQLEELARQIMLGDMRNAARLDTLARRQQAVLERWQAWLPDLRAAAAALPAGQEELRQEALAFADAAENAGIQRGMEAALEQARKDSTPNTFVNAQLALVGMDTLLNSGNKLCQSCKDGGIRFMTREGLSETLAQMLAGMCRRRGAEGDLPGQGMSPGQGGGGEGDSGDGFSTEGDPLVNAPVFGPARMSFSGDGGDLRGRTASRGSSGRGRPVITAESSAAIVTEAARATARRQISLRDVPERYREAVRRFYGEENIIETTAKEARP